MSDRGLRDVDCETVKKTRRLHKRRHRDGPGGRFEKRWFQRSPRILSYRLRCAPGVTLLGIRYTPNKWALRTGLGGLHGRTNTAILSGLRGICPVPRGLGRPPELDGAPRPPRRTRGSGRRGVPRTDVPLGPPRPPRLTGIAEGTRSRPDSFAVRKPRVRRSDISADQQQKLPESKGKRFVAARRAALVASKPRNNTDLSPLCHDRQPRRGRPSTVPGDRPRVPPYGVWEASARTVSGKQVVYVRRSVHRARQKDLQNAALCSALGRTRTCDLLIRSDRFGGFVDSHRVPFDPYLWAFRRGTRSLDPHTSPWSRAHKW
jgi:hypothetical protein